MGIGQFFKRRKLGPLSVSPFGLAVFALFLIAVWLMADGVYRDKAIQDGLMKAIGSAVPIATEYQWRHEQTGKWPTGLGELPAAASLPPQVSRVELLQDKGVRLFFSAPEAIASGSLTLSVVARDGGRFLECGARDMPEGSLPSLCRGRDYASKLEWPPAGSQKADAGRQK